MIHVVRYVLFFFDGHHFWWVSLKKTISSFDVPIFLKEIEYNLFINFMILQSFPRKLFHGKASFQISIFFYELHEMYIGAY